MFKPISKSKYDDIHFYAVLMLCITNNIRILVPITIPKQIKKFKLANKVKDVTKEIVPGVCNENFLRFR